ncbi:MAG: class I SAM-dependent methyltransferase [Gemmatimonadaceae bacterium]
MSRMLERPPVEEGREAWQEDRMHRSEPTQAGQYVPFGNVEARNGLQAQVEIPLMIRALRLPLGARVLEIGCGRGVALPVLDDRLEPLELIGLDVDPALLAEARERVRNTCTNATLVEGDVRELPFEAARFDLVIDFGTCYHASATMEGRRSALSEVARVLREGGLFVHETRVAQRLAHPVRSLGRVLPWGAVPSLVADRSAVLWGARRKVDR